MTIWRVGVVKCLDVRRLALPFVVFVLLLAAGAASASQPRVTFRHGTFYVRSGVSDSSLLRGVLGVGVGSTSAHVRAAFGRPRSRTRARVLTCWWYPAKQPSSSLDGLSFCISRSVVTTRNRVPDDPCPRKSRTLLGVGQLDRVCVLVEGVALDHERR